MPEIISRKEAIERGMKRYFTGEPCKYGHTGERQVSDGKCIKCVREYEGATYVPRPPVFKVCAACGDVFRALCGWRTCSPECSERLRKFSHGYKRPSSELSAEELAARRAQGRKDYQKKRERRLAAAKKYAAAHKEELAERRKAVYRMKMKDPEWRKLRSAYSVLEKQRGPLNPKEEKQWLRKNRAQLQSVRRYLKNRLREQSQSSQEET